jgi:hypothetical protein
MTMNRDEVIEALASFAGPLGPMTTLEERLERQDRWVDQAGPELLAVLASIVELPPQPLPAPPEDWEVLVVEIASKAGAAHPDAALDQLLPLLQRPGARSIAVDVLGGVADPRAIPALGELLSRPDVRDDDRVRVAGALGDIGGDEACRLLRAMKTDTPLTERELHSEIDIALRSAGCV